MVAAEMSMVDGLSHSAVLFWGEMDGGLSPKQQAFVAAYLGPCRMNATKAAETAGYTHPNKQGPALLVNLGIQEQITAWREEAKQSAITDISYRVARLHELESKLWEVIDERANDRDFENVAGGNTGLIVHDVKAVGAGPSAQLVDVYAVDTGTVKAIQSLYDDVAKELGQRVDRVDVSGSLKREYVVIRPDGSAQSEEST